MKNIFHNQKKVNVEANKSQKVWLLLRFVLKMKLKGKINANNSGISIFSVHLVNLRPLKHFIVVHIYINVYFIRF